MRKAFFAVTALLMASPAMAHHPLGGLPMETLPHGLLSGIGHPILGFDHLFFVAIMGVAALYTGHRLLAPMGYIAAMLLGVLVVALGGALPLVEIVVAASLLVLGGIVLSGRALSLPAALLVFSGFGLFHGAAFGAPLAAQEAALGAPVLIGYLIGLALVQYAIALVAGQLAKTLLGATSAAALNTRLSGALAAGAGLFLTLEALEGPLLASLFGV